MSCSNENGFKESVCIHTDKIYDSCRDKDCLQDLRVYLTAEGQCAVDSAVAVRCQRAEIIWVFSDIESVPFNRGYYSVDLKYFFKVTLQVSQGLGRPVEVDGLATFDKRVILFGSEGNAKVFKSKYKEDAFDEQMWKKTNMPTAVVEAVEPIVLGAKLVDKKDKDCCGCCSCDNDVDIASVPESVCRVFGDNLILGGEQKRVYVSLGVFSIIRLERRVMLLIPAYDFCIPEKECQSASTDDNPCELFERISFPVDEFFPPEKCALNDDDCGCGCGE
ncbi:MAG: hypothetical protein Q4B31_01665 [Clostridia bacterium]|nr:hypothetical protein [Clostridia bacterium]